MPRIGSHISSARGYLAMGRSAAAIGADTLQFFLRNPRGGRAKAVDPEDVAAYLDYARRENLADIMGHAPYVLNPASNDERIRTFTRETLADDLTRMELTPGNFYNLHPGTRKGQTLEEGVAAIAETLEAAMPPKRSTTVLLETMSGRGNEVGGTFEELRAVIDACRAGEGLGVCLDTCHVFAAGYDIRRDLKGVLKRFDRAVGLDRLKALHLNDSMFPLGAGKDRHARLGEGEIGLDAFAEIVNHPALRDLPMFLETPNDADGYAKEIALLKSMSSPGAKRKPRKKNLRSE